MRIPSSRFYGLTLRQGQVDFSLGVDAPEGSASGVVIICEHLFFGGPGFSPAIGFALILGFSP
jgi:hypothetical protein